MAAAGGLVRRRADGFDGTVHPLEAQMADDGPLWREIAQRHGLAEPDLGKLASAWHTDLDLGRPIEVMTDMSKSRLRGFLNYVYTPDALYGLFRRLAGEGDPRL